MDCFLCWQQLLGISRFAPKVCHPSFIMVTYDRLCKAVDEWTEAHEIKPPKRDKEEMQAIRAERKAKAEHTSANTELNAPVTTPSHGGGGLIKQILDYPLEDSTPMDNYSFIERLKQQITSIL